MNILLVDDEPIFIDKLRLIIEQFSRETGIATTITGEAYSAQEALKGITAFPPDIVFTDIKMSSMSGVELAAILQKDWPGIFVVIISGYPSFEYAREAMRANVVDYLLKPIKAGLVKEQLLRLHPQILLKSYQLGKRLIQQFMENDVRDDAGEDELLHKDDLFPCYRILVFPNVEGGYTDRLLLQQSENRHASYITELQRMIGTRNAAWMFNSHDSRSYVVVIGYDHAEGLQLQTIAVTTREYFSNDGVPVTIAFSGEIDSLAKMKSTIQQLLDCLYHRLVIGKTQDIHVEEEKNLAQAAAFTHFKAHLETKLSSLFAKKDASSLKKEFLQLFQVWKSEQCPSVVIESNLKRMIRLMERSHHAADAIVSKSSEKAIEEVLHTAVSFEEAASFCWEAIAKVLPFQSTETDLHHAAPLFERIHHYLVSHLSEPIGLAQLNEQFHVSNTFLSNLFRNYANASFVEYFTTLRMDKAKELIRDHPGMMLKDIAELVGFGDHHYFSRVFKTVTGQTPSEYRSGL
ncbi:response regulator transcription factor [Cohnella soli]|uniref:Helix-turn-helix domain-containing protein n=1 Tax=Cohnella soli TaxID=425005 RepID=A0ABW0HV46_9BACL